MSFQVDTSPLPNLFVPADTTVPSFFKPIRSPPADIETMFFHFDVFIFPG